MGGFHFKLFRLYRFKRLLASLCVDFQLIAIFYIWLFQWIFRALRSFYGILDNTGVKLISEFSFIVSLCTKKLFVFWKKFLNLSYVSWKSCFVSSKSLFTLAYSTLLPTTKSFSPVSTCSSYLLLKIMWFTEKLEKKPWFGACVKSFMLRTF